MASANDNQTAMSLDKDVIEPQAKRPRLGEHLADAIATAAAAGVGPQAANDEVIPNFLVTAPVVSNQISNDSLLPALQQLLSVYKAEYWALLEELRAQHNSTAEAAAAPAAESSQGTQANAAQATNNGSFTSLQTLWREVGPSMASRDAAKQQQSDVVTAGDDGHGQQQQQQQQQKDTPSGHPPSPFAAAADPLPGEHGGGATARPSDSTQQQQQQQQQQQTQLPNLQQVERLLQQLHAAGRDSGVAGAQQLQEWRKRFADAAPAVAGLEQLASAAALQYMDTQGGLACLCGQAGRWVVRRSAVSIGRSSDAQGEVDIDLGKAAGAVGCGSKLSRQQAQLLLTADGQWSVTNTGRAPLVVNGQQVAQGSTVQLPHLSLLEVAELPLLFMVNSMAVTRAVTRSLHLTM